MAYRWKRTIGIVGKCLFLYNVILAARGGDFFPDILFETMFPSTAFLHCLCAVFESCIGTAPLMSTQV